MSGWSVLAKEAAQAYPGTVKAVEHLGYTVRQAIALGLIEPAGRGPAGGRSWCHLYRATERGLAFADGRVAIEVRTGPKRNGRPNTKLSATWLHARPQFSHSQWEASL